MYSQEVIQTARQASLVAFLLDAGEHLIKEGNRYKHAKHDSLVFKDNMFYWNSKGDKGNGLDYLTRHMGYSFTSAVAMLAISGKYQPAQNIPEAYEPKEKAKNYSRVFAYLTKTRAISPDIVNECIKRKLLYQASGSNNAAFVILDENKQAVGEELQGTLSSKSFKGLSKGTKYGYGFNILPKGDTANYLLFFESVVDLLSFWTLGNIGGKPLTGCMLVSMAGLKQNIIKHMTSVFGGKIVLCVDNDDAGNTFVEQCRISGLEYIVKRPTWETTKSDGEVISLPKFKDWNDELKHELKGKGG